jgi:hypothetical protein
VCLTDSFILYFIHYLNFIQRTLCAVLFIRAPCTLYNSIPIPRNPTTSLWILFCAWSIDLKNFHHSILSPSHAYLKSDLRKTFELDLSAHPPALYIYFFNQKNLWGTFLVYGIWITNIPTVPMKRPVGPTICTASDWDFESCSKIYILVLQNVYGYSWIGLSAAHKTNARGFK